MHQKGYYFWGQRLNTISSMHADLDILKTPSAVLRIKGKAHNIILLHISYILYFYYCIMFCTDQLLLFLTLNSYFHESKGSRPSQDWLPQAEKMLEPRQMLYKGQPDQNQPVGLKFSPGLGNCYYFGPIIENMYILSEVFMWQTFNCD